MERSISPPSQREHYRFAVTRRQISHSRCSQLQCRLKLPRIGGIVGGIQRLQTIANPETRIVPARGRILSVADLRTQLDMYGTIYDRLTQMLNRGRGPSEAVEAKPTKEFDDKMGNGDVFVRRSFESLWAYLSPDA